MDDFLPTTTRKHIVHLIAKQFLKSTACICPAITTWLADRTLRSTTLSPQVSFNLPMTCSSLEIVQQEPTQAEIHLQSCDKPTEPNTTCTSRECRPTATPKLLIMATARPIYLCADGSQWQLTGRGMRERRVPMLWFTEPHMRPHWIKPDGSVLPVEAVLPEQTPDRLCRADGGGQAGGLVAAGSTQAVLSMPWCLLPLHHARLYVLPSSSACARCHKC